MSSRGVGGAALRLRVGINTGRRSFGSASAPARGSGCWPATRSTPPRGSSRSPRRWAWPVGLVDLRSDGRASSTTKSSSLPTLKGKAAAVRVFWAKSPLARLGTDLTRSHETPVHRARDRSRAARRHLREGRGRERSAARDRGGRARARQVQDRGGAGRVRRCQARPDRVASGSVLPVRRRHHALGAGRGSSRRTPGSWNRDHPRPPTTSCRSSCPRVPSASGSVSASIRCSGWRRPRPPSARSPSRRGAGSSSTSPNADRRSLCSRICTGPTKRCSRSWSISPIERTACPS